MGGSSSKKTTVEAPKASTEKTTNSEATSQQPDTDTTPKDTSPPKEQPSTTDETDQKEKPSSTEEKSSSPSDQQLVYLSGVPGSGKTFIGDYLATRGWYHVDGDMGNQSKEDDVKARWSKLAQAMEAHQAGKTDISTDLWSPYFEFLVQEFQKGIATGKNVVISFALLGVFGTDMEFWRSKIPGIKFVVIEVSIKNQVDRLCARSKVALAAAGTSEEEVWGQDYMAEYREKYGQEYTPERYRQMTEDGAKDGTFVRIDANDDSITTVNNDNFEDFSAIKAINKIFGLDWQDVDTEKIAAVNTNRMKNLNLEVYDTTKTEDAEGGDTKTENADTGDTKTENADKGDTKTENADTGDTKTDSA